MSRKDQQRVPVKYPSGLEGFDQLCRKLVQVPKEEADRESPKGKKQSAAKKRKKKT